MKRFLIATTAISLLIAPVGGAFAQGWDNRHDDHRGNAMSMRHDDRGDYRHDRGNHRGWYKGGRIDRSDWNRGHRVNDWQRRHLQRPPRGYEWRRVDNNYVLAAAATGLIAALVMANQ